MKLIATLILCSLSLGASAERIKDIAKISGVRSNHLIGYGLVVGLDGTGDNTSYTTQSFKTLLSRFGVQMPAGVKPESKNIAAVAIHADLPAFAKPGHQIDITVSSIGNAKSLRGGTLLMSYLKGIDNKVYAVAQGNLLVGGFGAEGKDGSQIKVNVPVVGRIAGGATIEVEAPSEFGNQTSVTFLLNRSDFTTSKRMADAINQFLGNNNALPEDSATVIVKAPPNKAERVRFLSALENLSLESGEAAAKIVVNSRTGTIVVGKNVRVGPAAVAHGSLSVTITERVKVSQPEVSAGTAVAVGTNATANASSGTTVASPTSEVFVSQPNSRMFLINKEVELESIVRAINEVGAAPGDLMAILEALKQVGALEAEIEVI